MAMLSHLLGPFLWIFPGLVIWFINKDRTEKSFAAQEAKEALNFQITLTLVYVAGGILMFVLIGAFILGLAYLANLVLSILAAVRTSSGVPYRYPFTLRLVK